MIVYTALGDSITAGELATSPRLTYPALIQSSLQRREKLATTQVLAEPGWTSQALIVAVIQNPSAALQHATTVSIWVGGNDLIDTGIAILQGAPKQLLERRIQKYAKDLAFLVRYIRRCSNCPIVICTQYNPFPNSGLVEQAILALNTATETVGQTFQTQIAPVHSWFAGRQSELIAGYRSGRIEDVLQSRSIPIHPNNPGHRVIAENLISFIR